MWILFILVSYIISLRGDLITSCFLKIFNDDSIFSLRCKLSILRSELCPSLHPPSHHSTIFLVLQLALNVHEFSLTLCSSMLTSNFCVKFPTPESSFLCYPPVFYITFNIWLSYDILQEAITDLLSSPN